MKPKCAVCRKSSGGILVDYATILLSMGYIGHKLAHTKCVLKAQQMALNLREKLRNE